MADKPPLHALLYGDPGSGKSTGIATFPKPMLVLMFDPYGKETPYLKRGVPESELHADFGGTPTREVVARNGGRVIIRIEHYLDPDPSKPTAFKRFIERLTRLETDIREWDIKTIVLDSVTFCELAARKYAQYVLNPTTREPRQWFGAATDMLEEVIMIRFGALPINVGVLAHIEEDKDEVHGTMVRNPAAPGRLRKRGAAGFSELYRAYVKMADRGEREFFWQTRSDGQYNCASQVGAPDPCGQDYRLIWTGA